MEGHPGLLTTIFHDNCTYYCQLVFIMILVKLLLITVYKMVFF